ncbi:MAG: class II aldolase/adducin family protein, partial [Pseudomonas sp.]|nr:class II aldolase/adducin family protein [Pseudomonas sp.]
MTHSLTVEQLSFLEQAKRDFAKATRVLKNTRTLTATNTFQAYVRVPQTRLVIALHAPGPWA